MALGPGKVHARQGVRQRLQAVPGGFRRPRMGTHNEGARRALPSVAGRRRTLGSVSSFPPLAAVARRTRREVRPHAVRAADPRISCHGQGLRHTGRTDGFPGSPRGERHGSEEMVCRRSRGRLHRRPAGRRPSIGVLPARAERSAPGHVLRRDRRPRRGGEHRLLQPGRHEPDQGLELLAVRVPGLHPDRAQGRDGDELRSAGDRPERQQQRHPRHRQPGRCHDVHKAPDRRYRRQPVHRALRA